MRYYFVVSILIIIGSSFAEAFPEMSRIGYQNCVSCHVSPTGGGVLTPYGRGMASDILSTWHYDGEESIGHGLIKNKDGKEFQTPDWIQVGGESRWIQTYVDNLQATQRQWFAMQNEIETALKFSNFSIVGNLNIEGGPPNSPDTGLLVSERLFGMFNLTDETYLRAGKYLLPFGIDQANHTSVISKGLGWDEGSESDNFEVGYIGEKYNLILTTDFGRPDNLSLKSERGVALNLAYNLQTTHKLGWSTFSGNSNDNTRLVTGPYAILGFFRKLVLLSQFDMQFKDSKDPAVSEQRGFVVFNRLQYEVVKGLHPYVIHQIAYPNSSTVTSRYDSYGGGLMWFPRPHFEFWAEWDKERNIAVSPSYTDSAWLVLHYYL